jgi:hypothetical protein
MRLTSSIALLFAVFAIGCTSSAPATVPSPPPQASQQTTATPVPNGLAAVDAYLDKLTEDAADHPPTTPLNRLLVPIAGQRVVSL